MSLTTADSTARRRRTQGIFPTSPGSPREENCAPGTHDCIARWLFGQDDLRRVLDVPCGEGAFVRRCLAAGRSVVGADCEPGATVPGAERAIADMNEQLPFEDAAFDAVVCIDGIEHIERPFDFLAECRRVVRVGGALVVSTPNISALRSRWRYLWTGFHNKAKSPLDETAPHPLHHVNMRSFHELRYQLHRTGFRIERVATNRIKPISWLYSPLAPPAAAATAWALHAEEKDPAQRRRNWEIWRQLHSPAVLFGEALVLFARKG